MWSLISWTNEFFRMVGLVNNGKHHAYHRVLELKLEDTSVFLIFLSPNQITAEWKLHSLPRQLVLIFTHPHS